MARNKRKPIGYGLVEVEYMCAVIRSCVTIEQLANASSWAYSVLGLWNSWDDAIAMSSSEKYLKVCWLYRTYYKKVEDAIKYTLLKIAPDTY